MGQKKPIANAVRYTPVVVFLVVAVVAFSSMYKSLAHVLKNCRFQASEASAAAVAVATAILFAFLSRFPIARLLKGSENRPLGDQLRYRCRAFHLRLPGDGNDRHQDHPVNSLSRSGCGRGHRFNGPGMQPAQAARLDHAHHCRCHYWRRAGPRSGCYKP
jgi:hypothetical protein